MSNDRRTFLKRTGAALSAAAAGACSPGERPSDESSGDAGASGPLDPDVLRAVAPLVLPSELGDEGREQAVRDFERWASAYEPVPELSHGYGTAEIRYGPPDPVPGWAAQLRALELEAVKRHGQGFASLAPEVGADLLRRHVTDEGGALPSPLRARHVAVALMAWWLATPDATDRCYGVRVSPRTCRGIATAPPEPEALP
jgi:hypothetical protein